MNAALAIPPNQAAYGLMGVRSNNDATGLDLRSNIPFIEPNDAFYTYLLPSLWHPLASN